MVLGTSTGLQAGHGLRGKALQQLLKEIQQQLVVGASVATLAHTQSSGQAQYAQCMSCVWI